MGILNLFVRIQRTLGLRNDSSSALDPEHPCYLQCSGSVIYKRVVPSQDTFGVAFRHDAHR